jgi:hypothetical protein
MRIKEHRLYELYLAYLNTKNYNSGQLKLATISSSLFEDFESRLDNDPQFRKDLNSFYLDLRRKDLISEILDAEVILKMDV